MDKKNSKIFVSDRSGQFGWASRTFGEPVPYLDAIINGAKVLLEEKLFEDEEFEKIRNKIQSNVKYYEFEMNLLTGWIANNLENKTEDEIELIIAEHYIKSHSQYTVEWALKRIDFECVAEDLMEDYIREVFKKANKEFEGLEERINNILEQ